MGNEQSQLLSPRRRIRKLLPSSTPQPRRHPSSVLYVPSATTFAAPVAVVIVQTTPQTPPSTTLVHYAALVLKARQLVATILASGHSVCIEHDGPTTYAVFTSPLDALAAAAAVPCVLAAFNEGQAPSPEWHLRLAGVAVTAGDGESLAQDATTGSLHGPLVDEAKAVLQAASDSAPLVLTPAAMASLADHPLPDGLVLYPSNNSITTVALDAYHPPGFEPAALASLPPPSSPFVSALLKRFSASRAKLAAVDKRLSAKYIRETAVVAVGYNWVPLTETTGVVASLAAQQATAGLIRPIVESYQGAMLDPALMCFESPVNALSAALEIRSAIALHNTIGDSPIPVLAFGAASGKLLLAPDTDVHWGEPVFAARSLAVAPGAAPGELVIANSLYAALTASKDHDATALLATLALSPRSDGAVVVQPTKPPPPGSPPGSPPSSSRNPSPATPHLALPTAAAASTDSMPACDVVASAEGTVSDSPAIRHFQAPVACVVSVLDAPRPTAVGPLAWAASLLKVRQALLALFQFHGALLVEFDSNSAFAVFDSGDAAVAAASLIPRLIAKINASSPNPSWAAALAGVGAAWGPNLLQDLQTDKFVGGPVTAALALANSPANGGKVLIADPLYRQVATSSALVSLSFDPATSTPEAAHPAFVVGGKLKGPRFRYDPARYESITHFGIPIPQAAEDFVTALLQAYTTGSDDELTAAGSRFITPLVALAIHVDWASLVAAIKPSALLASQQEVFVLVKNTVAAAGGFAVSASLALFPTAPAAFAAGRTLQSALGGHVLAAHDNAPVPLRGLGLASGRVLVGPETDVVWGSALELARELAGAAPSAATLVVEAASLTAIERENPASLASLTLAATSVASAACAREVPVASLAPPIDVLRVHDATTESSLAPSDPPVLRPHPHNSSIAAFSSPVSVVVTHMAGFSRITRKHGIVHYASLVMRMRVLMGELMAAHGALCVEAEADKLYILFAEPASAVAAALQVKPVVDAYNRSLACDDDKIRMSGVGVAHGGAVVQDLLTGKYFGPPVDSAFVLAADLAAKGEVLVDATVAAYLDHDASAFTTLDISSRGAEVLSVSGSPRPDLAYVYPGQLVVSAPPAGELDFERDALARLSLPSRSARAAVEAELRERYMQTRTVLMYGVDWSSTTKSYGVIHTIGLKQAALQLASKVVSQGGGTVLEETLFVFNDVAAALDAALALHDEFTFYNRKALADSRVPLLGLGLHTGELLLAPNTDIHWGEPVSLASRLAELAPPPPPPPAEGPSGARPDSAPIFVSGAVRERLAASRLASRLTALRWPTSDDAVEAFELVPAPVVASTPSDQGGSAYGDAAESLPKLASPHVESTGGLAVEFRLKMRVARRAESPEARLAAIEDLVRIAGSVSRAGFKVRRSKINCINAWSGTEARVPDEPAFDSARAGGFFEALPRAQPEVNRVIALGNYFLELLEEDKSAELVSGIELERVRAALKGLALVLTNGGGTLEELLDLSLAVMTSLCKAPNGGVRSIAAASVCALIYAHIPHVLAKLTKLESFEFVVAACICSRRTALQAIGLGLLTTLPLREPGYTLLGEVFETLQVGLRLQVLALNGATPLIRSSAQQVLDALDEPESPPPLLPTLALPTVSMLAEPAARGSVSVEAGSVQRIRINAPTPGTVISFAAKVHHLDVGLAVEYRKRNSEPVAFHHQVILFAADSPYRRWFVAPKAGRYDLVLDNEYSWFASKSVSYAVHVLRPDAVAP
ncbi:uncharacterized protein AMSG_03955 [Thecamonas trahens ATCC 50062]|uniref:GOLD domain-containing protein n=1 Tax=Thecamonas trahens ATCC 50062 TaxID=461836 RepID=A0A0L0D5S9_THETB|nr:hypothetical protein AMSG_03955 [Thecamonas trahens ATCC 50062]KNC47727.1 hypothetical protein AMSG_03955 [Thecamonas trahens ATCC 50062]|eukprot:XP_013759206.1 hypothetical protein AMSG_03955 [Thecamonas trahens ATCC 50062]